VTIWKQWPIVDRSIAERYMYGIALITEVVIGTAIGTVTSYDAKLKYVRACIQLDHGAQGCFNDK